jgi:hypothetical protein
MRKKMKTKANYKDLTPEGDACRFVGEDFLYLMVYVLSSTVPKFSIDGATSAVYSIAGTTNMAPFIENFGTQSKLIIH